MPDRSIQFWMQIIDQMNSSVDVEAEIPDFLRQLCVFLGFGFGFTYRVDHKGTLWRSEYVMQYEGNPPPDRIALAPEHAEALMRIGHVSFRGDTGPNNAVEEELGKLLGARCLDVIPISFVGNSLLGMVGIGDRRSKLRVKQDDTTFAHSVLISLAMYIKAGMYLERVRSTENVLTNIMDNMGVDVYVNDFDNHEILYANSSMAKPYGGVQNLVGCKCWQALYDDKNEPCDYCPQKKLIDEEGVPSKTYSWDYERPFDKSWFRVMSTAFHWVDGRMAHVVSSVDITENKNNEMLIRRMAEYDQLTGLPNRHMLNADCDALIERGDQRLHILFLDMDGFKQVNDSLGHTVGDELLRQIGAMFQEHPQTRDRTYRYGGDEFVIICEKERGAVEDLLLMLQERFSQPWVLDEHAVHCAPSIGITRYPDDGIRTSDLIRKADFAMYDAKKARDGQVYCYNKGEICPLADYKEQV